MDCKMGMEHISVHVYGDHIFGREVLKTFTAMDVLVTVLREYKAEWQESLQQAETQAMINQAYPLYTCGPAGQMSQVRDAQAAATIGQLQLERSQAQGELEVLYREIAEYFDVEDWKDPCKGITELEAHINAIKPKSLDLEKEFEDKE
jgi:ferredoxin-NADP reductase